MQVTYSTPLASDVYAEHVTGPYLEAALKGVSCPDPKPPVRPKRVFVHALKRVDTPVPWKKGPITDTVAREIPGNSEPAQFSSDYRAVLPEPGWAASFAAPCPTRATVGFWQRVRSFMRLKKSRARRSQPAARRRVIPDTSRCWARVSDVPFRTVSMKQCNPDPYGAKTREHASLTKFAELVGSLFTEADDIPLEVIFVRIKEGRAQGLFDGAYTNIADRVASFRDAIVSMVGKATASSLIGYQVSALKDFDWSLAYNVCVALYLLYRAWDNPVFLENYPLIVSIVLSKYNVVASALSGLAASALLRRSNNEQKKEVVEKEEEATAQAEDYEVKQSLHTIMCQFFGIDPEVFAMPTWESISLWAKRASWVTNIMRLVEMVSKWVQSFYDWTKRQFFRLLGFQPSLDRCTDIHVANIIGDWSNRAESVLRETVEDPRRSHFGLRVMLEAGVRLRDAVIHQPHEVRAHVSSLCTRLAYAADVVEKDCKKQGRSEPLHLCFVGPPGVLKTTYVTTCLIPLVKAALYPNLDGDGYFSKPVSPYWDAYDPDKHPIVLVDELTGVKREGAIAEEMLMLVSTAKYLLNMAFSDKGKVSFDSEFLFSCTNRLDPKEYLAELGVDHDAFMRRRTPVLVRWKPSLVPESLQNKATWNAALYKGGELWRPSGIENERDVLNALEFCLPGKDTGILGGSPYTAIGLNWCNGKEFTRMLLDMCVRFKKSQRNRVSNRVPVEELLQYVGYEVPQYDARAQTGTASEPSETPTEEDEIVERAIVRTLTANTSHVLTPDEEAEVQADILSADDSDTPSWLQWLGLNSICSARIYVNLQRGFASDKYRKWFCVLACLSGVCAGGYGLIRLWQSVADGHAQSGEWKPAKKVVKPRAARPPAFTYAGATHEATANAGGINMDVVEKVRKNLCRVTFDSSGTVGIGLVGPWVLVPYHLGAPSLEDTSSAHVLTIQTQKDGASYRIPLTREWVKEWIISEEGDYMLIRLPKNVPPFVNIVKHIAPFDATHHLCASLPGYLVRMVKWDSIVNESISIEKDLSDDIKRYSLRNGALAIEVRRRDLLFYEAAMSDGDCASPIFASVGGMTRVVGMHAMAWADNNVRGICAGRLMPCKEVLDLISPPPLEVPSTDAGAQAKVYLSPQDVETSPVDVSDVLPHALHARVDHVEYHHGRPPSTSCKTSFVRTSHSFEFKSEKIPAHQSPCDLPLGEGGSMVNCLPVLGQIALCPTTEELNEELIRNAYHEAAPALDVAFRSIPGIDQAGYHLTFEENLNGLSGLEPAPMRGAIGWPNVGPKRDFVTRDSDEKLEFDPYVEAQHRKFINKFLERMSIEDRYKERFQRLLTFYLIQKDEVLNWKKALAASRGKKLEKLVNGLVNSGVNHDEIDQYLHNPPPTKTRMVSGATSETNCLLRHVFGSVFAFLRHSRNSPRNPVGAGFSPFSGDTDAWVEESLKLLDNPNEARHLCIDQYRLDKNVRFCGIEIALHSLIRSCSSNPAWQADARYVTDSIRFSNVVYEKVVFRLLACIFSGMLGTEIIGALVCYLALLVSALRQNDHLTPTEVVRNLFSKGVGDDQWVTIGSDLNFDIRKFEAVLSELGLKATDCDKDQPLRWRRIDEVKFCSRSLKRMHGRWVFALDESSILSPFAWRQNDITDEAAFAQAADQSCWEYALHGYDAFTDNYHRLLRIANKFGYSTDFPNYTHVWRQINKSRQSVALGLVPRYCDRECADAHCSDNEVEKGDHSLASLAVGTAVAQCAQAETIHGMFVPGDLPLVGVEDPESSDAESVSSVATNRCEYCHTEVPEGDQFCDLCEEVGPWQCWNCEDCGFTEDCGRRCAICIRAGDFLDPSLWFMCMCTHDDEFHSVIAGRDVITCANCGSQRFTCPECFEFYHQRDRHWRSAGICDDCYDEMQAAPRVYEPPPLVAVAQAGDLAARAAEAQSAAIGGSAALAPSNSSTSDVPGMIESGLQTLGDVAQIVSTVSHLVEVFGLCRTRADNGATRVLPFPLGNINNSYGQSSAVSLGLDPNGAVDPGLGFMGEVGMTSMTMEALATTPFLIGDFAWQVADVPDTQIFELPVTPMLCHMEGTDPIIAYPGGCNWLAMCHRAWKGTMCYRIKFVKPSSAIVTGRGTLGFNTRSNTDISSLGMQYVKSIVHSLSESSELTFEVDFVFDRPLAETGTLVDRGVFFPRCHIGTLQFVVNNALSGDVDISVLVYQWMKPGTAEFYMPTLEPTSIWNSVLQTNPEARAQAGESTTTQMNDGQAVVAVNASATPSIPRPVLSLTADSHAGVNMGALERPVPVLVRTFSPATALGVTDTISLPSDWLAVALAARARTTFFRYINISHFTVTALANGTINQGASFKLCWAPGSQLDPTTLNENRFTLSAFPNVEGTAIDCTPALPIPFINTGGQLDILNPDAGSEMGTVLLVNMAQVNAVAGQLDSFDVTVIVQAHGVEPIGPTIDENPVVTVEQARLAVRNNAVRALADRVRRDARAQSSLLEADPPQQANDTSADNVASSSTLCRMNRIVAGEQDDVKALLSKPMPIWEIPWRYTATETIAEGESYIWECQIPLGPIGYATKDYFDILGRNWRFYRGGFEYHFLFAAGNQGTSIDVNYVAFLDYKDSAGGTGETGNWIERGVYTAAEHCAYMALAASKGHQVQVYRTSTGIQVAIPYYTTQYSLNIPVMRHWNSTAAVGLAQGARMPPTYPRLIVAAIQRYSGLSSSTSAITSLGVPATTVYRNISDDGILGFKVNNMPLTTSAAEYNGSLTPWNSAYWPADV